MAKKNELVISGKGELLDIFMSEEDRRGADLLKMSNYLDILVDKLSTRLEGTAQWEPVSDVSGLIGRIATAIKGGCDIAEMNMLVADTSHFSQDIVDGLKKGIYHIGQSKEVAGNLRPAVLDDKERLVKFVTLKKAINPSEVLADFSNISMQLSLRQISNQIEAISRDVHGLIEFNRRETLSNKFIYAREKIMRASHDEVHREQLLEDADTYLMEGLVDLYADIDAEVAKLGNAHGPFRSLKEIDNSLTYINEDMQMIPRYVGLRAYLLNLRGMNEEATRVLGDFRYHLECLTERELPGQNLKAIEVIHRYYPYEKQDTDFWLVEPKEMLGALKSYEAMIEQKADEIFYIQEGDSNG